MNPRLDAQKNTLFLLKNLKTDSSASVEDSPEAKLPSGLGHWLLCSLCRNKITSSRSKITVSRNHTHTFVNPSGLFFRIGCFQPSPGCLVTGEPSLQHTWFPGYSWQISHCSGCKEHLGWHFQAAAGDNFFALILDKLVEEEQQIYN